MATSPTFQVSGFERATAAIRARIGMAATIGAGPVTLPPALAKRVSVLMVSDIKQRFQTGTTPEGNPWPPIRGRLRGGDKPLLDTGTLRASIWGRPEVDGATAGTNDVRAPLMNYGGKVVPRKAKFLALPLTREALRAGSPLNFPRKLIFVLSRKGNLIMAEVPPTTKTGKPKKPKALNAYEQHLAQQYRPRVQGLIPHYVLLKQVNIPARKFIGTSPEARQKASLLVASYFTGGPAEATP